jgi:hypothetical protein
MLPLGQMWLGADAAGKIIAASIEARPHAWVMEGCATIIKCRVTEFPLGRDISDFQPLEMPHD